MGKILDEEETTKLTERSIIIYINVILLFL